MYLRVLDDHYNIPLREGLRLPHEINSNYKEFKYQTHAINKGLNIIEANNGLILGDVVGLGKSIIASAIANNLKLKTFVIAPPHLKTD